MKHSSLAASFAVAFAFAAPSAHPMDDDAFFNTGDIKWGAPPPVLPKGAKFAVLSGDPGKPGPYTVRLAAPANYKIAPHWHSRPEDVTVISGVLYLGMGDKLGEKGAHSLKAGGFTSVPAKMHHYAFSKGPTVIQISGEGPFDINYLDPKDNPLPQ